MIQATFDFDSPKARRSDPASSRQAAAELEASGALSRQRREVLEALKRFGPSTSAELAQRSGLDRYTVARRLPELRKLNFVIQGEVRNSLVGRPAVEWRAK